MTFNFVWNFFWKRFLSNYIKGLRSARAKKLICSLMVVHFKNMLLVPKIWANWSFQSVFESAEKNLVKVKKTRRSFETQDLIRPSQENLRVVLRGWITDGCFEGHLLLVRYTLLGFSPPLFTLNFEKNLSYQKEKNKWNEEQNNNFETPCILTPRT